MNACSILAAALDPARILAAMGLVPDAWQKQLLLSRERQVLLNCSRQSGKSTVVSVLALHTALFQRKALVLLVSPTLRQSGEIFRKVVDGYRALGQPVAARRHTQLQLELGNGSRIICLPSREGNIRSYGGVSLLVIDEAARVPDDVYRAVRPMLAVSQGRLVALSTPFGQRGWFYDEWVGGGPWQRVQIPWRECPRIGEDFVAEEVRALGRGWVEQEYECRFSALEGLVYPDFEAAAVDEWPNPTGRRVGGIDFGWRNPFAAVWGVRDRDDVLWLAGERYTRQTALYMHAAALADLGDVMWYADPSGATEITELRAAGLAVRAGVNDIRAGIAAVTARLQSGRLKIHRGACPQLLKEARLYRYPRPAERALVGENPVDEHNHALGALRYLISRLDAHFMARQRRRPAESADSPRSDDDELLWTRM